MNDKLMQTGRLIIITGPSGVGKGTLVKLLTQRHPELYLSVSATTRPPRVGEVEGRDYFFKTSSEFEAMINQGELLEWAKYAGNYYGTPRSAVKAKIAQGKQVLLEIEVVGARQVEHSFPDAVRIFILPPSMVELQKRLWGRGKDDPDAIALRLKQAKLELEAAPEFDYQIVNDHLDTALKQVEAILFK
jgi:guanylate kinase